MSSDLIQVLDIPKALPGKCIVCGYTGGAQRDGRKFIDFQFDMDFYGAVIFCENCITTCANKLDYLSPEQVEKLTKALAEVQESLQKALAENAKLRSGLDSLDFLGTNNAGNSGNSKPKQPATTKTEGQNTDGPSESTNKRRSSNVSKNDEIDPVLGI